MTMTMQVVENSGAARAGTLDGPKSVAAIPTAVPREVVSYQDENIRISNLNAEFGIKQHALKIFPVAEITAARMRVQRVHVFPAYSVALIGFVWGAIMLQTALLLGLGIAAVGIVIALLFRAAVSSSYFLRLTTSSGEQDVLMSLQKKYIKQAVEAINKVSGNTVG